MAGGRQNPRYLNWLQFAEFDCEVADFERNPDLYSTLILDLIISRQIAEATFKGV
jgi:hypothetical protein